LSFPKNASSHKNQQILFYELPRRKQRGIFKSIERPKGREIKPHGDSTKNADSFLA